MLATKFIHEFTLDHTDLLNGVRTLLIRGGLEGFIGKHVVVYPRLTLEFLSTIKVHDSSRGLRYNYITFNAFNNTYCMTYPAIAEAFGWEFSEDEYVTLSKRKVFEFWGQLARGFPYLKTGNKIIKIRHPAMRYV